MDANQKISLGLLIGRLITVFIMIIVVRKQYGYLKAREYPELHQLRKVLLWGSLVILMGNIVPIIIDTFGLLGRGSFAWLLTYVISNNLTAMLSAYMMWYSIKLTEKISAAASNDPDEELQ